MLSRLLVLAVLLSAPLLTFAQDAARLSQALTNAEAFKKQGKYAEALRQYEVALDAGGRFFGPQHLNVGAIHGEMGVLLREIGEPVKAKASLAAALRIYERGDDAALKAEGINNLAAACVELGEYGEARTLHERGFQLLTQAYGVDSPEAARSLGNLAGVYSHQGRDGDAEAMYRKQALLLARAGPMHADAHANSLMNLATIYQSRLDFLRAEPLYLTAIGMLEAIYGPRHFKVARVRNNLATLYGSVGQFERAEAEHRRGLEVLESAFGKNNLDAVRSKSNLASMLVRKKNYAEAERLYREVIAVREEKLGPDHPDVGLTISALGELFVETSRFDEARELLERGLAIRKRSFGEDSAPVARSLSPLGFVALREKKLPEAEKLFQQSLALSLATLPADHPDLGALHTAIGLVRAAQGKQADALREFDLARRAARGYIQRVLPALSDGEQLTYLREVDEPNLHAGLGLVTGHLNDRETVERTAEWALNGKGVAAESAARRALVGRDVTDPQQAKLLDELNGVRKQMASLLYSDKIKPEERKSLAESLARREQELAKQLGSAGDSAATPWLELAALRARLQADDVYIDVLRVHRFDYTIGKFDRDAPGRYLAWVIPPAGAVTAVDLGSTEAIDAAVRQVRSGLADAPQALSSQGEVQSEAKLRVELGLLADLVLKPLLSAAGDCKRIYLSPDSSLWLVPWAALPVNDQELLLEKVNLQYAASARELLAVRSAGQATRPILFADPDYDLSPAATRALQTEWLKRPAPVGVVTAGQSRFGKVERLPASQWEAAAIQPKLKTLANDEPYLYANKYALESVFKTLQRPRFLLISTHGFFQEAGATAAGNPLLNCGLLLAGCNQPAAQLTTDLEDGILTGLEIVGADLRGTELVVLSACETGLGAVRDGDGVAGLRQAFQLAGAKAVVSTLWEIPDRDSALIMNDFFTELTAGKSKAEALRVAQLKRLNARREKYGAAHPFYWAAWTLTGD